MRKLESVTLICPDSVNWNGTTYANAELAVTTNDGDVNLINDFWKLTKIDVDLEEKRTMLIEQEMIKGQEIQGYVRVIDNIEGRDRNIRVKIYFKFSE